MVIAVDAESEIGAPASDEDVCASAGDRASSKVTPKIPTSFDSMEICSKQRTR
jgi:hypothetical protein